MGLDIYLYDRREKDEKHHNVPSQKHPDHLCNRRYLRSSYNEGGFNTVMANLGLPTFYDIFAPPQDGNITRAGKEIERVPPSDYYYWTPSPKTLLKCWERACEALGALRASRFLRTATLLNFGAKGATSSREAIKVYEGQFPKTHDFGSWSDANGYFFGEPLPVLGAISGRGGQTYLVYEGTNEIKEHYIATAEITIEFIEEAMALGVNARHSWSG